MALAFSRDGHRFAAAATDGSNALWRLAP